MKIKSTILCCALIAMMSTSCSSNSIAVTSNVSDDFYNYSIGLGETVYAPYKSYLKNEDFCDFIANYDFSIPITIYSVKQKDGTDIDSDVINVSKSDNPSLDISCLKPFDNEISIDQVVFKYDDTLVGIKYNIELTFNPDYSTYPVFPRGYSCQDNLGNNFIYSCDLLYYFEPELKFYLIFRPYSLHVEKGDSYIINSVLSNDDLFTIEDLKYGATPPSSSVTFDYLSVVYGDNDDIDFVDFEKIDLADFETGFLIQFGISYDRDSIFSIGGDVKFNIEVNGDSYDVLFHIFYSSYR